MKRSSFWLSVPLLLSLLRSSLPLVSAQTKPNKCRIECEPQRHKDQPSKIPQETCDLLNDQLSSTLLENDAHCVAMKNTLSMACNCKTRYTVFRNGNRRKPRRGTTKACALCTSFPQRPVPPHLIPSLYEASVAMTPPGFQWTCGLVDALLRNYEETEKACIDTNEALANFCSCGGIGQEHDKEEDQQQQEEEDTDGSEDDGNDQPNKPSKKEDPTPPQDKDTPLESGCNICGSTSTINNDQLLQSISSLVPSTDIWVHMKGSSSSDDNDHIGTTTTVTSRKKDDTTVIRNCQQLVENAHESQGHCSQARRVSSLCGCPLPKHHCRVCPVGYRLAKPDRIVTQNVPFANAARCDTLEAWARQSESTQQQQLSTTSSSKEYDCMTASSFARQSCGGCVQMSPKELQEQKQREKDLSLLFLSLPQNSTAPTQSLSSPTLVPTRTASMIPSATPSGMPTTDSPSISPTPGPTPRPTMTATSTGQEASTTTANSNDRSAATPIMTYSWMVVTVTTTVALAVVFVPVEMVGWGFVL